MYLVKELDSANNSLAVLKGDYAEEGCIKMINALQGVDDINLLSVVSVTVWCNCDVISNVCKLLNTAHSFADLILKNRMHKFLLQLRNYKLDESARKKYSERFRQSPEVAKEYVLYFLDMLSKDLGDKQLDILVRMFVGYVNSEFENEEQFHTLVNINSGMFLDEYDVLSDIFHRPILWLKDDRLKDYFYVISRLNAKGLLNLDIGGHFVGDKTIYADVSDLGKKFCGYIQGVPEKNLFL